MFGHGEYGAVGLGVAGNVVIDVHFLYLAVNEKLDAVDASFVNLLSQKHALDTAWLLRQSTQHRQEVAVAQFTLQYVLRRDAFLAE